MIILKFVITKQLNEKKFVRRLDMSNKFVFLQPI